MHGLIRSTLGPVFTKLERGATFDFYPPGGRTGIQYFTFYIERTERMVGKKVNTVILGAGESGVGAAILARQLGHDVFVSDKGSIKEKYKKELRNKGIPYEEGQHSEERIFQANTVVKSPGIPDTVPLVIRLREKGIPVISEIEFAYPYTNAYLIGITGSNGKTTTTMLTFHLLKEAGWNVGLAGNVGFSFARSVAEQSFDYYVLELSSFQLDGIDGFRPNIAILLNITPDHLDRYGYDFENYIQSKFRISKNLELGDLFLYNGDDQAVLSHLHLVPEKVERMEIKEERIQHHALQLPDARFDMQNTALRGRHNYLNALFAICALRHLGVADEAIRSGLTSFVPVAHRLEPVAILKGVSYINDSKATNVDAVFYALQAMDKPIVWIVGGKDKGNDYDPLLSLVREKVKAIVCMGVDNRKLMETFSGLAIQLVEAGSAQEAVSAASELAEEGDVVLLSPACASFDLFRNYEDRGDQFREAVLKMKNDQ